MTADLAVIPPELSDLLDWWLRRLLDAERAAYIAGYAAGHHDGYERGTRQMQAEWPAIVRPLSRPSRAEIEAVRWELRGERRTRETFGQPHPNDYPGQDGAR
jgi:hypothetical protein